MGPEERIYDFGGLEVVEMGSAEGPNLLGGITMLLVICCLGMVAQGKYGGGTGEPNDPYQIWDANDMQAIGADANDWDKCFVLMADIDLGQFDGRDGREKFNIIGNWDDGFRGVFDGNDHTISNFTYVSDDRSFVGLFGVVGGEIKNLGLIDAEVDPGRGIVRRRGGVAGSLTGFLIDEGIIINCYAEGGSVTGDVDVGGLVGASFGTMINCYATGSVRCSAENDDYDSDDVGGLVGWNAGAITNCYATGNVTGSDDDYHVGYNVGGLVGWNGDAMTNCYATGSVTGDVDVGGLVGYNNHQSTITKCYATGSITGDSVFGGLVGYNNHRSTIILSYWDIETSGEPNMCGNSEDPNCNNSYGLPTSEMKQQSTFSDWDFVNVWAIAENQTYPYLRTHFPGDMNHDGIVNMIDFSIFGDYWLQQHLHAYNIDDRLRLVCANNLRALGRALRIYANDYDDELPTPSQWCDLLLQHESSHVTEKLFVCPSAEPGRSHYAINANVTDSSSPPDMVLLFETGPGWNQFGGPELLAPENHQGKGCHILFHDGHVEFVQNEHLDELRWERK